MELFRGLELAWAEYGDPSGVPLFYFHGFPGSLLEGAFADRTAGKLGIRFIAVERPGYGESPAAAYMPGDLAAAVAGLADDLAIDTFSLLGLSGGAPYALACGRFLSGRVRKTGIIGGMGLPELEGYPGWIRLGLALEKRAPGLAALGLEGAAGAVHNVPGFFVRRIVASLSREDRQVLEREEVATLFTASLRRGTASGRGMAADLENYVREWRFLHLPGKGELRFWHGEEDRVIPIGVGRAMALRAGLTRLESFPGEGHVSLPIRRMETILSWFVEKM